MSRADNVNWGCGGHRVRRGSYDEYDHSDEELYVYDQCCQNCRFYNDGDFRCSRRYRYGFKNGRGWCVDWKGTGGRR